MYCIYQCVNGLFGVHKCMEPSFLCVVFIIIIFFHSYFSTFGTTRTEILVSSSIRCLTFFSPLQLTEVECRFFHCLEVIFLYSLETHVMASKYYL